MKKTYQNPEMKVVKIEMTQMIAASPGYGGETGEGSGNLTRRRNNSLWDDEEEEEY